MQDQNLFLRNDTFFGICEALGTDFGFHPNWLRVAFAVALFFDPALTAGTYLALGVPVVLARWIYPARSKPATCDAPLAETAKSAELNDEQQALPLAA